MTAHRVQQLERLIRRLRNVMLTQDDAYAARCGRLVLMAKRRCHGAWNHRYQRGAELRLDRQN